MRVPTSTKQETITQTKTVADSSVYLSADYSPSYTTSSATGTAYTFGGDKMETVASDEAEVIGAVNTRVDTFYFYKPSGVTVDDYRFNSSGMITIVSTQLRGDTLTVRVRGSSSTPSNGTVYISWIAATGYFVVNSVSIPLEGVTQYGNAYSISGTPSFTVNGGNGTWSATAGSYSLSSNGQTLTVTNLHSNVVVGGTSVSTIVTVSLSVRVRHDYITGYSGTASVQVTDADPYDLEVSSVSSNVTSHSTPYLSRGYIYCTLYGDDSGTASVPFSYKVDTTATVKVWDLKFNGQTYEKLKINGEIQDPNNFPN